MINNFKSGTVRVPVARPVNTDIFSGTYDGKEMRPYEGRPGANNALAIPSRMGNSLHYRDGSTDFVRVASDDAEGGEA